MWSLEILLPSNDLFIFFLIYLLLKKKKKTSQQVGKIMHNTWPEERGADGSWNQ